MRVKPVILVLTAVVALASGCGNDKSEKPKGNPAKGGVEPTDVSTCMSERGFTIRPAAVDIAAQTGRGVQFDVTFYRSPEAARTSAGGKPGAKAVENSVVVVTSGGTLKDNELAAIRGCIRENE